MKTAIKNSVKGLLSLWGTYARSLDPSQTINKASQILLTLRYRELFERGKVLPLEEVEFRLFSQTGEDGILLYLFALLGMTNRRVVEICAGDGIQCLAANLLINHGFTGLLVDGDPANVRRGRRFYRNHGDTCLYPPAFVQAWVTKENVNRLITENGFSGDVDLLSLDLDGVDYWIWREINCIRPRIVVVECNKIWGPDEAVTVPYRADFREYGETRSGYHGASPAAFVKLGREKGYRLVGCQRYGFNAFFLRDDTGRDVFPEIPAAACYAHPFAQPADRSRLQAVLSREWVHL